MIELTENARKQIRMALDERDEAMALRVGILGRGNGGFRYFLDLVPIDDRREDDAVFDGGGFDVFVDSESAPQLAGTTVDFVSKLMESGFEFTNPNTPWSDPLGDDVQRVIEQRINPAVASHGGFVTLLDVRAEVAYIQLGGGCQGCGQADATLKQGIEVMIKEAVPAIREVLDTTDHAAGTNPYYRTG